MGFFSKLFARKPAVSANLADEQELSPEEKLLNATRDALLVLHWAAMADNQVQDTEKEVILAYSRERASAGLKESDREALITWIMVKKKPDKEAVQDAIYRLSEDTAHAQLVRRYAQSLVKADGVLEKGEIRTIQLLSRFFAEADAQRSRKA